MGTTRSGCNAVQGDCSLSQCILVCSAGLYIAMQFCEVRCSCNAVQLCEMQCTFLECIAVLWNAVQLPATMHQLCESFHAQGAAEETEGRSLLVKNTRRIFSLNIWDTKSRWHDDQSSMGNHFVRPVQMIIWLPQLSFYEMGGDQVVDYKK